jgi:hypothetical protein
MPKILSKLRFKINPYIRYKSFYLGDVLCVNQLKREVPIVISIASKEENFSDLELSLYSILNQSVMPDRIILWLSNKYGLSELPYEITRFIKNGLEIRFVNNLGDYTKIIYPLKEFPDSIIVTASDCIYYEKDWLKKLYHSYASNPGDVHAHLASRLVYNDKTNELTFYKNNTSFEKEEMARFDNMASGFGGILYPPGCFRKEVFREDIYANFLNNSDVWMWLASILSERKTRIVKSHIKNLSCVNLIKFLRYDLPNSTNISEQIKYLITFYAQNISQKLKK